MSKYDIERLGAWRHDIEVDRQCPVILVGEDNPQSADPRHALYPYPVGCAGCNFSENISNVGMGHHLATWRTNLCNPRWSQPKAVERARELFAINTPWSVLVLLGTKVAGAFEKMLAPRYFGLKIAPFSSHKLVLPASTDSFLCTRTIVSLPHPSGRCRVWNDAGQVHRARALLATAAPGWYGECE